MKFLAFPGQFGGVLAVFKNPLVIMVHPKRESQVKSMNSGSKFRCADLSLPKPQRSTLAMVAEINQVVKN